MSDTNPETVALKSKVKKEQTFASLLTSLGQYRPSKVGPSSVEIQSLVIFGKKILFLLTGTYLHPYLPTYIRTYIQKDEKLEQRQQTKMTHFKKLF